MKAYKMTVIMMELMVGCMLVSWLMGSPPGGTFKIEPRASKEGERLLRQAHEAFTKGDFQKAYQIAKKVYDKEGDVYAAWFVEPNLPPSFDPYNLLSGNIRELEEYARKHGKVPSLRRVIVSSSGLIIHSLFKLKRYQELEPYALEILSKDPHATVIKIILDASRRLLREKARKEPLDHTLLVQLPDGRKVVIDVERGRRERAGVLYTPADDIARLLGLRLDWQGNQVIFHGKDIKALVQVGSDQVQINSRTFKLPKPTYMKGKELLVPIELLQQLAKAIQR